MPRDPSSRARAAGEAVERRLRGAVDRETAVAGRADDRRDVDDGSGAAGQHDPAGGPGHVDGALEVQVDHLVERLVAEEPDDALTGDAGVVDQDVDAAPADRRILDEARPPRRGPTRPPSLKWNRSLHSGSSSQAVTVSVTRAGAGLDAVAGVEERLRRGRRPGPGCRR